MTHAEKQELVFKEIKELKDYCDGVEYQMGEMQVDGEVLDAALVSMLHEVIDTANALIEKVEG